MYRYTPDEIDRHRAEQQADRHGGDDVAAKRIGNLGELAFEQFCREYLPVELWTWTNADAIRYGTQDSFLGHDFEVFGYEVDVKTSRDISAFLPEALLDADPNDDVVVMVWHRDNEDSLMLLGWERVETLASKAESQERYSGDTTAKLDHLAVRPMNELIALGPNTAYLNQTPENPFTPGDRVVRADDIDPAVAVVVEAFPPEAEVKVYGSTIDGETVEVAYPSALDGGPSDWRELPPGLLAAYCRDHDIPLWDFKHTNLEYASNPFVPGDHVVKTSHDDPDVAVVVASGGNGGGEVLEVVYLGQFEGGVAPPGELLAVVTAEGLKRYSYSPDELAPADRLRAA